MGDAIAVPRTNTDNTKGGIDTRLIFKTFSPSASLTVSFVKLNLVQHFLQLKYSLGFEGSPEFEWVNELAPMLNDQFGLKDESKKVMAFDSNIDYSG